MKKFTWILIPIFIMAILAGCTTPTPDQKESKDVKTDILIIGAGGAGLTAAITAAENGSNVTVIEKMPAVGGNTIISATGITASDTKLHEEANMPFTVEDHIQKTMETGKGLPNEELVTLLAQNSSAAYDWLVELGMKFKIQSPEEPFWIVPVEGHYGAQLISAMKEEAAKYSNLEILVNTQALELVVEDGKVAGAKVKGPDGDYEIKATNVILSTGGLNNNPDMIAEYNSKYTGIHTEMTTPGATGDGITMALEADANLVDMEHFQIRPLSSNGNWYKETLLTEEGKGGILVNLKGNRFANETLPPKELATEILKQDDRTAYFIFDQEIADTKDGIKTVEKANAVKADTIEELAKLVGLDASILKQTIDEYNNGKDQFGRSTMGKVTVAPFYAAKTLPSNHYTMGGVEINANAQVLNTSGQPIEGFYAAGEVVGGLYGSGRVAGNNTLDDIVFGKIAGNNASNKK